MYIDFEKMPTYARLWVYQADKDLDGFQIAEIQAYLIPKIEQWVAHDNALLASMQILYNRFLIIALDETKYPASGCSIDSSTRWLKDLGSALGIDFFDRSIAYLEAGSLQTFPPFQAKQKITAGLLKADTIVFQNNIETIEDLSKKWQNKAIDTYLKRYFVAELA